MGWHHPLQGGSPSLNPLWKYICFYVCVLVPMCAQSPEPALGVFLHDAPHYFLKQGLSLDVEHINLLEQLASKP